MGPIVKGSEVWISVLKVVSRLGFPILAQPSNLSAGLVISEHRPSSMQSLSDHLLVVGVVSWK